MDIELRKKNGPGDFCTVGLLAPKKNTAQEIFTQFDFGLRKKRSRRFLHSWTSGFEETHPILFLDMGSWIGASDQQTWEPGLDTVNYEVRTQLKKLIFFYQNKLDLSPF